jgi:glycosyltransferase involved in cell wall biosynthesis
MRRGEANADASDYFDVMDGMDSHSTSTSSALQQPSRPGEDRAASMPTIRDVSFVVIARDERVGIEKCLSSFATMALDRCEVICVDSASTDGTLDVMRRFDHLIPGLRIVRVTGYANASIARNAGLRWATRKYVFFLDGDVEPDPRFLAAAVPRIEAGAGAVTGKLRELQYTSDFGAILKEIPDRAGFQREGRVHASGGCFIASRAAVEATGLFDERLTRTQDYDYTLRLSRRFPMLAIPVSMGTHHTVGYDDRGRFAVHLKQLHALYYGAVLRRNCAHVVGVYWLLLRYERGIALGGVLLALGITAIALFGRAGLCAAGASVAADLFIGAWKRQKLVRRLYMHYGFPALVLIGCLYLPDHRAPYKVEQVFP